MKSQLFFVFTILTTVVVAQPADAINWKTYMSTPNQQGALEGNCATYASVHCMEALYNYWHALPSKLEIDMPHTSSMIQIGSSVASAVTAIKSDRLKTISGSYPN